MIGEGLVENFIVYVVREQLWKINFLKCKLINPSEEMRVAFSAMLRITDGSGYLLVRNLHRPETFGPFGGVYKYFEDAIPQLDNITFNPQIFGPSDDMKQDLRGFLPRKNLPKLLRWYRSGNNRENYNDCLCRELKEELKEVALLKSVKPPNILHFRLVRSVLEGPERVPGQTYTQFRIFEIYDLFPTTSHIKRFIKRLLKEASEHPDLLTVTAQEIRTGRARDGGVIGHHCGYLISHKRLRPDTPMFVSVPTLKKDQLPASQTKKRLRSGLVKALSANNPQDESTSNGVVDGEQNKNAK
jgi:SMODS-associated NUDIX domain